ncbi:MAG: Gfo/Idh/MocA family oxidoreductase [Bryobacteraceae bacterium]|nr:Gfo/Idh/MocA family oxidoreductase [Bryobacteraceae bacterium]MDW8380130.1 Gfo/Idh/MocA family oxidoreductase [Bryobacterales bacterium]
MQKDLEKASSRREFLSAASQVTKVSALAGVALPHVHAAENNTLEVALVGAGGRGTGAAGNALSVDHGPIKLVAMADIVPKKLSDSYDKLKTQFGDKVDVPAERRFLGFDAYRHAMDALKPGGIVILATPPAFRWVHFQYAIEKGLHTFMEKPVTVDGPTTKRMFELADRASRKNLKAAVGLMVRHCRARQELLNRIRDGQIGEIIAMRAYRMGQRGGTAPPKPPEMPEVMYQLSRFHAFLWASGGVFSDYYIHQIDECSWMKGAWPVEAHGLGGRHYRGDSMDQNFDVYSVEFVYPDGTRLFFDGRNMAGARDEFASYAHGSKGSAVISTFAHTPGLTRIYKGHHIPRVSNRNQLPLPPDPNVVWAYPQPEKSPYQLEWDDLIEAIRKDTPYNEVRRGAEASLVTSMGRMAAHTGQLITYEQMLNCPHEFAPDVDKLTPDGPAPLQLLPNGKYPMPEPGIKIDREY